jgi:hypothetical protein
LGLFSSIVSLISPVAGDYLSSKAKAKATSAAAAAQNSGLQSGIDTLNTTGASNQSNIASIMAALSPYISGGTSALTQQMQLLGLGSPSATSAVSPIGTAAAAAPAIGGLTDAQAQQLLQDRPDVLAEFQRASAAGDQNSPAFAQGGLTSATDYARHWYNNMGGSASYSLPSAAAATPAAGAPTAAPDAATQQQDAITALQGSPLYTSLMRNGQNTILSNASATGGLRGGNIQRSLADFGSDTLASVIQQQLSNLSGISGQGLSATGTAANTTTAGNSNATSLATQLAALLSDQGSVKAGGILGKANANLDMTNSIAKSLPQLLQFASAI